MKKINVITLGCSKNTVDSEHLMARLAAAGYEVVFDSDRTDAKTVVINTCGFIGDAKQESIDMILRAAAAKQAGKIERLFVIGCLSERYADDLRTEIPEVDAYFGARTWDGVVRALEASGEPELATERMLTTPEALRLPEDLGGLQLDVRLLRHPAHPRRARFRADGGTGGGGAQTRGRRREGTDRHCAGHDLLRLDLYGKRRLAELLRRLCRIDGIGWIRLHYAYPTAFPDEVIEAMTSEPKICKYLDIPFQHISDAQLSAMHRHHTKAEAYALVEKLRGRSPTWRCARRCWSAIPVKRKRISQNWNSSYGTYGSNASGSSPIPRRRAPTRHKNSKTTSRRRSSSSAWNAS